MAVSNYTAAQPLSQNPATLRPDLAPPARVAGAPRTVGPRLAVDARQPLLPTMPARRRGLDSARPSATAVHVAEITSPAADPPSPARTGPTPCRAPIRRSGPPRGCTSRRAITARGCNHKCKCIIPGSRPAHAVIREAEARVIARRHLRHKGRYPRDRGPCVPARIGERGKPLAPVDSSSACPDAARWLDEACLRMNDHGRRSALVMRPRARDGAGRPLTRSAGAVDVPDMSRGIFAKGRRVVAL